jgi:hypothetical protein
VSQQLGAPTLEEANLFDITGPIVINYSRSSIAGIPLFSYRDAESDLSFSGGEINQVRTPMGEFVTVTLQNVPDAFVRTFTLIVPNIRLQMGDELPFDTVGIEVTDRSGAHVPPPGPSGVLTVIRIHQLSGVAQYVIS